MSSQKLLKILLLIIVVIPGFSGITICASNNSSFDTISITIRQPDPKIIESYRSQKEFNYTKAPVDTNFIKRVLAYMQKRFGKFSKLTAAIPWFIKILLGVIVLFFLFVVITQTKLYKFFYSSKEIELPAFHLSSNYNELVDYDKEITANINQHQFRLAIRLLYLKVIQKLSNNNYIQYSKNKTNVDYLRDLSNTNLKSEFKHVTLIYNHVWYGEIEIEKDQFLRFEQSFQSIYNLIDVQK